MTPDILTVESTFFDFTKPEKNQFTVKSVAHALSHICRFTGHSRRFYSVAQHSVLVSYLVPKEFALQGLMHDAVEAFIGDMTSPLKMIIPQYKELEKAIEPHVLARFGLPAVLDASVKRADLIALAMEKRDLVNCPPNSEKWWSVLEGIEPAARRIYAWPSWYARLRFRIRYWQLTGSWK